MNSAKFSISVLSQLAEVVEQLSEHDYCHSLDVFSGASIGQHTRHILEFYSCILEQKNSESICYDSRKRDLSLETDKSAVLTTINNLTQALQEVSDDRPITLHATLQDQVVVTSSSLSREMLYALEHAVHHMAIIKIGLLISTSGITIPKYFGVADSTIQYRNQCAQ